MNHRPPVSAAFALVLACAAPAQQRGKLESVGWPFGVEAAQPDAGAMFDRRDLFNLGLIGAKAWDADRKEPAAERQSGQRRFASSGKPENDNGPKRLVIRALLGGAPGQRAGLQMDDVVVGVNQRSFAEGCFQPLADALLQAEAETGRLTLQVERGGATEQIEIKLKKAGKEALTPHLGKQRRKILDEALDWLAERQVGDGSFPATLSGGNGEVVQSALAGLAWLAGGSTPRSGKHRANIEKALQFVERGLYAKDPFGPRGGGASWDQTNWAYVHAILFLGECQLAAKGRKPPPFLQKITTELCARQEASGGYAHGPGGKNALDYLELNILGGYVMSALSVAKQAGCEIDDKLVKGLLAYLEASAGEDGGVGYAADPGQKGHGNIGRTAGAWLGAKGLGLGQEPFVQKMRAYVGEHCAGIMDGHASLMQHILLGGLGAKGHGAEATEKFWKVLLRDLVLARSPDGSCQPRPWHESLMMESNSDVSFGEVWTTACWAIVLAADDFGSKKGGLPGWLAKDVQ